MVYKRQLKIHAVQVIGTMLS